MKTEQVLKFLREHLPHGGRYKVDNLLLNRDEMVGYMTKSIVGGDKEYQNNIISVDDERFNVALSDGELRIVYMLCDWRGVECDWILRAAIEIKD